MTERAQKYLYDILNAIELIELFSQGIDNFNAYQADLKTKSAVERQLAIIGEAVTHFKKHETESGTKQYASNHIRAKSFNSRIR